MSFRNRCTLLGGNGPISLSIPLAGGRDQKTLMKDLKIDNGENWRSRHWKTIFSCYNKSPWFEFYRSEVEMLYRGRQDYLLDWNIACHQWICDKMAIRVPWSLTTGFTKKYDEPGADAGSSAVLDLRNVYTPSTINSRFPATHKYPQVFQDRFGFVPNLSILDYLFCAGNKIGGS